MGKAIQRKVERICRPINSLAGDEGPTIGAHVSVHQGEYHETADLLRAGIEKQSRFILSVFGFGSSEEHWRMNVYEFYRDFVRAYEVNKERERQLKKNNGTG